MVARGHTWPQATTVCIPHVNKAYEEDDKEKGVVLYYTHNRAREGRKESYTVFIGPSPRIQWVVLLILGACDSAFSYDGWEGFHSESGDRDGTSFLIWCWFAGAERIRLHVSVEETIVDGRNVFFFFFCKHGLRDHGYVLYAL